MDEGTRTCRFEGCEADAYGRRQWCNRHYFQRYRNGAMGVSRSRQGRKWRNSHGYVKMTVPGHVLANERGEVYEHRLVLFDAIGPGQHCCHWCGAPVGWSEPQHSPRYLTADHLDFVRDHNVPSNLVPSCFGCNNRRALHRRWSTSASAR